MGVICPTITASDAHAYRDQLERISGFAQRIHLDFADGKLAPVKLVDLKNAWLPEGKIVDLHLMYKHPAEHIKTAVELSPNLVIVHAEAEGSFLDLAEELHKHKIKVGVALLPDTQPELIEPSLEAVDHVLIFSGKLGHFGGRVDLSLLEKVKKLKELKPSLEIGWDGGINSQNIHKLVAGGVDVLNVGGYIQHAERPQEAYATLEKAL